MVERSRPWTGTTTGDAGPYSANNWAEVWRALFSNDGGVEQGVIRGLTNELAGTTAANQVNINTGGAVVYGRFYVNDASVAVTIPSATAGNERIDRIVLRADWTLQTIRITRIAGVNDPAPTAPAITQTADTTWDMPLYQARVTDAGVVTLTDEREFVPPAYFGPFIGAGAWELPTANFPQLDVYAGLANWAAVRVLRFDDTTGESCYALVRIPSKVTLTTMIFRILWFSPTATTGGVRWQITHKGLDDNENLDTAGTAEAVTATAPGTVEFLDVASITIATPSAYFRGDLVMLKLERVPGHAGDTMVGDAYLLGVQIEFV